MSKKIKKSQLLKDIIINIGSSMILVALIQLIIFPILSRFESLNNFGLIVTLYGFSNVLIVTLGNSLNNIRLINNDKIKEKGNFNFLLIIGGSIALFVSFILLLVYGDDVDFITLFFSLCLYFLGVFVHIYLFIFEFK